MKEIKLFFNKINSFAIKEIKKRTIVSDVLKKEIGESIPFENISFSKGVVVIKCNSVLKNQIYIKKEKIILSLKEKIGVIDIK